MMYRTPAPNQDPAGPWTSSTCRTHQTATCMLLSGLPAPLAAPRAGPIEHRAWCGVKCLRHLSVERFWRRGSRSRTRRRRRRRRTTVRARAARTPVGTAPRAATATTTSAPRPAIATSHAGSRRRGSSRARGERRVRRSRRARRPATSGRSASMRRTRPSPGPNRLHGSARREDGEPERRERERPDRAVGARCRSGRSSRRRRGRGRRRGTRLPKFSPRTGVEHARHIGRPHPSHRATAGLPGWRSHRSSTFDERSSGGTTEGYRHPRRG